MQLLAKAESDSESEGEPIDLVRFSTSAARAACREGSSITSGLDLAPVVQGQRKRRKVERASKVHRAVLHDKIRGITYYHIKSLAAKSGVLAMSGCVPEEIRMAVKARLERWLHDAVTLISYHRSHVLMASDMLAALEMNTVPRTLVGTDRLAELYALRNHPEVGQLELESNAELDAQAAQERAEEAKSYFETMSWTLPKEADDEEEEESCDGARPKELEEHAAAIREIHHWQKDTDPVIPYLPLVSLVREVCTDYKSDLGFDQGVFEVVRGALEAYMVLLLGNANLSAIQSSRKVIDSKDIQFACQ